MDSYFTSVPLFHRLQQLLYGAVGTTRPHKDFPEALCSLNHSNSKLEWNTLLARVVNNTLCLAWQDNNIVLALSTIHTVHTAEDFVLRERKRPAKTSTSGRIVRAVFGDQPTKELGIPTFIDDYNHNMGGVDIANQLRESYEVHKATKRNLWPLFYWLIDTIIINSYRLYQVHVKQQAQQRQQQEAQQSQQPSTTTKRMLSHSEFRTQLYRKLLSYSFDVKIRHLQLRLSGKRHYPVGHGFGRVFDNCRVCDWCRYQAELCKLHGGEFAMKNLPRSRHGCTFCQVALCSTCFNQYHD